MDKIFSHNEDVHVPLTKSKGSKYFLRLPNHNQGHAVHLGLPYEFI